MAKTDKFNKGKPKGKRIRINDQIRAREVRVVGPDGGQIGVLHIREAQTRAQEHGLDLIEIAPQASPPVCRIGDFGKMRYDQTKKDKQLKKNSNQQITKTVKMKPNIGESDLTRKIADIDKFLTKGHRVVVQIRFKGREKKFMQLAQDQLLGKIKEQLPEATMEKPSFQGYQITATFSKPVAK
jgi:translation initiation factor IF-3